MTDNTQPEALRLAELLELAPEDGVEPQTTEDAAAELRRLHAECEALRDGARAMRSARWYMLNKDGMATLCTSKKDAAKEARAMDMAWPHMGPHRAVQLVEVGTSARGLIDAAQAVIDRWDTPLWKDVEPTAAVIGRLRAAVASEQTSARGES